MPGLLPTGRQRPSLPRPHPSFVQLSLFLCFVSQLYGLSQPVVAVGSCTTRHILFRQLSSSLISECFFHGFFKERLVLINRIEYAQYALVIIQLSNNQTPTNEKARDHDAPGKASTQVPFGCHTAALVKSPLVSPDRNYDVVNTSEEHSRQMEDTHCKAEEVGYRGFQSFERKACYITGESLDVVYKERKAVP